MKNRSSESYSVLDLRESVQSQELMAQMRQDETILLRDRVLFQRGIK